MKDLKDHYQRSAPSDPSLVAFQQHLVSVNPHRCTSPSKDEVLSNLQFRTDALLSYLMHRPQGPFSGLTFCF